MKIGVKIVTKTEYFNKGFIVSRHKDVLIWIRTHKRFNYSGLKDVLGTYVCVET